MADFANASFTGSNGASVESVEPHMVGTGGVIDTNRAKTGGTSISYYDDRTPPSPNYDCGLDIFQTATASASGGLGPTVRQQTSDDSCYTFRYYSGGYRFFRINSGVATQIGATVATPTIANGTSRFVTCRAENDQVSGYVDDVLVFGPTTNASISAAGFAGWRITSTQNMGRVDAFVARTLGGAAAALEAGATGTATASGTLTTGIAVAGAATATATATAALGTGVQLAAAAVAVATANGTLTTLIPLSAAAGSVSTASGALTAQITLSAEALAQATATADITVIGGADDLEAHAAASASSSATLTTVIRLTGAALADATASADLMTEIRMESGAAGEAGASGLLITRIPLSAAAIAQALASGALTTEVVLAANAVATATAGANLTTTMPRTYYRFTARTRRAASLSGAHRAAAALHTRANRA